MLLNPNSSTGTFAGKGNLSVVKKKAFLETTVKKSNERKNGGGGGGNRSSIAEAFIS